MIINYIKTIQIPFLKISKSVKGEGRMEDEDAGSRLPLAIYLKDSNVLANIHRMMLSE